MNGTLELLKQVNNVISIGRISDEKTICMGYVYDFVATFAS